MDDKRYAINLEWCGYPERRYVVRFCGEWLGQHTTPEGAANIAVRHARDRGALPK